MPQFAIQPDQIRRVTADRILGRQTTTGPAEELSATDAKTLLGLGSSDSPTFAGLDVTNWLTIDGSSLLIQTPNGVSNDARVKLDNGGGFFDIYAYSNTSSPYLRLSGTTPGSAAGSTIRHYQSGGTHWTNFGNKDGASLFSIDQTNNGVTIRSGAYWGFATLNSRSYDATPHTTLFSDAEDILALRNGVNAMAFRIYNTDDGSQTNYGRASIGWDSNVNGLFVIDVEAAGTGTQGTLAIRRGGQNRISFPSNSSVTIHKSLYPSSNGSIYNGWSSLRWANVYSVKSDISQLLTVGGDVSMPNLPTSDPASAGLLWNDSGTLKVSAG